MKTTLFASLALASLMFPSVASAQGREASPADARFDYTLPPPPAPVAPPAYSPPVYRPARRWYGWQTMIGQAASDATIVASIATGAYPMALVGLLGKGLTGPIVHTVHGHPGKAAASVGITAGAVALCSTPAFFMKGEGAGYVFILGATVGLVLGPIIDIAALSTEEIKPRYGQTKHPLAPQSVGLAPIVAKGQQGLAFTGTF